MGGLGNAKKMNASALHPTMGCYGASMLTSQHHLDEALLNLRMLLVSKCTVHHHLSETFQPLFLKLSQNPGPLLGLLRRTPAQDPPTHAIMAENRTLIRFMDSYRHLGWERWPRKKN